MVLPSCCLYVHLYHFEEHFLLRIAFTASALSPLLATKSFGVFAAILVFYNYFSVIIFFPTVVMVYHLKFESWKWPCFSICKKKKDLGMVKTPLNAMHHKTQKDRLLRFLI
jgi:hypothetical protein